MTLSDIKDFSLRRMTTRLQAIFADKPVSVLYKALLDKMAHYFDEKAHFKNATDHLAQRDTKDDMLSNSYVAYPRFTTTTMQKLEKLKDKEQECVDLKKKLQKCQAEVRNYQNTNRLLNDRIRKDALTSAAKIDELELKLADSDYKHEGFDRYKRKTEVAVRLSNTYRGLQALEQAEKDKLEAGLEAKEQPVLEVSKGESDASTQVLNASIKARKLTHTQSARAMHSVFGRTLLKPCVYEWQAIDEARTTKA